MTAPVYLRHRPDSQVRIAVVYRAGMRDDPIGHPGLAHLAEHVFLQDFARSGRGELGAALRGWSAHTFTDTTEFFVACHPSGVVRALDVLVPAHAPARATEATVGAQQRVVIEELAALDATPRGGTVWRHLPQTLFADWSLRHDGFGAASDVESLGPSEVADFLGSRYTWSRCAVAVLADDVDRTWREIRESPVGHRLHRADAEASSTPPVRWDGTAGAVGGRLSLPIDADCFAWRLPLAPELCHQGDVLAFCAALNELVARHAEVFAALGYAAPSVGPGFFDYARATPPWVAVVVADHLPDGEPCAAGLWAALRTLVFQHYTRELHDAAARAAGGGLAFELADPTQQALAIARQVALGGRPSTSWPELTAPSQASFLRCRAMVPVLPVVPDGTVIGIGHAGPLDSRRSDDVRVLR